jgi:hypothetical protein
MLKPIPTMATIPFDRSRQATTTTANLQQAVRDGVPMLIPGAREPSLRRPIVPGPGIPAELPHLQTAAVAGDRGRFEHEREGGGAPSERSAIPATFFARLTARFRA